ncbi:MAG: hypothetical protein ACXVW4_13165 [Nocardioides sp.]
MTARRTTSGAAWGAASALAVALLLALTSGCGGDAAAPRSEAGPLIVDATQRDALPTALLHGVLSEHGGCVLLRGAVVVWVHGTTWDAASHAVVLPHRARVALGETYRGGGGVYDATTDFQDLLGSREAASAVARCQRVAGTSDVFYATE